MNMEEIDKLAEMFNHIGDTMYDIVLLWEELEKNKNVCLNSFMSENVPALSGAIPMSLDELYHEFWAVARQITTNREIFMVGKNTLRDYGFKHIEEYYAMCMDSYINGNIEQLARQTKKLSSKQSLGFIEYINTTTWLDLTSKNFILDLLWSQR